MPKLETRSHHVKTQDGRTLSVNEGGTPDGWPVIWHHGTPAGGVLADHDLDLAEDLGIRFISFDRPGYGESSPLRGRRVVDVVDDVATIADALGFVKFGTIGQSGGGPHVLACAARLPERVTAAVSMAGVAPFQAEGLNFLEGMGEDNHIEFNAALKGREALAECIAPWAEEMREATAEQITEQLRTLLPPVDVKVVTGELADVMERSTHRALMGGIEGWIDDDLAFTQHWGFELDEITVPVQLWQGRQDLMVPFAHGEWLAERIPGAEIQLSDEDGHISIHAERMPQIFDWLLAHR